MTTVKELKIILEQYDDDDVVILSSDGEGNKYSPLDSYTNDLYVPEEKWRGEVVSLDHAEDYPDGKAALILYPVN